jgi:hypothetical protein
MVIPPNVAGRKPGCVFNSVCIGTCGNLGSVVVLQLQNRRDFTIIQTCSYSGALHPRSSLQRRRSAGEVSIPLLTEEKGCRGTGIFYRLPS